MEAIAALDLNFLREEIDGVIVACEHRALETYLAENRAGRGIRLTPNQRRAIWRVHEEREKITAQTDEMTFSQQRRLAVELVRAGRGPRPFDGVLIDEAQDLEPTVLRLLIALCKTRDRLFLTADPNQSIYGTGFRWADVHEDLRFRGRTGVLRKNYRSTRQIMAAADRYLAGAELEATEEPSECTRDGPAPLLRYAHSSEEQIDLIVQFVRASTRDLRVGLGGCAVLVPTKKAGIEIAQRLAGRDLKARFMEKKQIDLEAPVVKVITMHSAKGLEFPAVAVAALAVPPPKTMAAGTPDGAVDEAQRTRRRLYYVAMTRAMERLLVVAPKGHPLFQAADLDPDWWDIGSAT
jgi:superfamily I DNA/RNA helicase